VTQTHTTGSKDNEKTYNARGELVSASSTGKGLNKVARETGGGANLKTAPLSQERPTLAKFQEEKEKDPKDPTQTRLKYPTMPEAVAAFRKALAAWDEKQAAKAGSAAAQKKALEGEEK
jgi:hypothetical protein